MKTFLKRQEPLQQILNVLELIQKSIRKTKKKRALFNARLDEMKA